MSDLVNEAVQLSLAEDAEDPRPPVSKKLSGNDKYRVRQGSYRIVYRIEDTEPVVEVVKVGQRKNVFRSAR